LTILLRGPSLSVTFSSLGTLGHSGSLIQVLRFLLKVCAPCVVRARVG
jgi:hypothetical protein